MSAPEAYPVGPQIALGARALGLELRGVLGRGPEAGGEGR